MSQEIQKENKMGTMPIPKLLVSMSLPIMLSMLVQALYNIVDSMFVARLSEDALTAVSLVFPIQNLMIAVAAGTGVGINALLSRHLGEKQAEKANVTARNGIFLGFLSFVAFAVICGLGANFFLSTQTNHEGIVEMGSTYMRYISVFSIGIFLEITFERLLQSTGRTFYTMITQGIGAIINIILDPILIFGYFGFPKLGVSGAAIATIIGQIIAACLAIYFNLAKNKELNLNMRKFRPHGQTILNIYKVGLPSIIMQSIGSVMTFGLNKILLLFSSTAAAVLGIYFKLQSFIFMPIFGLNNGMIPIIAYNYGARNPKRIKETIKISAMIAITIMLIGILAFQFGTEPILTNLFFASDQMLEIGVPALRTISISFIFAGFCIITSATFQALGNGLYSLLISFVRQLIFILPMAYIFAKLIGLSAVWWSIPLAEIVSVIMCTFLLKRVFRLQIKPLEEPQK
ncbi:putative MATE family efflux protein [Lachnospiraceae bacterium PF1-21]|uniref:MATE family efflux transporter n=1 Tax=Ohessyouella blattaphilus TaxID=2949333 RepID=A0ABT1EK14_9FIRM|nr:MATE family efflux transporter [Ohessyouella blattaphilus]MCP1110112.1 MATE family efflux transporter [Ohessyouella blattaphilus]MCR8563506.1 MATE family efflux transporter [Ohessyouella blattaphilus]